MLKKILVNLKNLIQVKNVLERSVQDIEESNNIPEVVELVWHGINKVHINTKELSRIIQRVAKRRTIVETQI
jgi:hypothetical protein